MGCIAGSSGYVRFFKEKFTVHPKFHPQMVMFILEAMVPRVDLEGVSAACANVSTLPVTVQKLASSVDDFDSRLRSLETIAVLEVGGRVSLTINSRRNQSRINCANRGKNFNGIFDIP